MKICIHVHKFVQYHKQFLNQKKIVNCLWLSVEDEFVQSVLNIVCQSICTNNRLENGLVYLY